MTADEAAGDGAIYYAVSTDDRTTWKIAKSTDGERSIVRNNSGTWQYNSNGTYGSTTWTNGTTNTELATLQEAMEGASTVTGQFDVSNVSYSQSFSVASEEDSPQGIAFNNNGTKMFIAGATGDDINEYTLSTGFDVSTASYSQNFSVASQDTAPLDVAFNSDGTKMFIIGNSSDTVYEYTLSTGFDVSTASYSSNSFSVSAQDITPTGLTFNTDGTKMFITGGTNDNVYEYTLSTGFDVSTSSYSQSFSVASQETNPHGIAFNTDGTKMFIVGLITDTVYEYTLSTSFDVSTASYSSNSFSVSAQDGNPTGIVFSSSGNKMFITGNVNDSVYEYNVGTTSYTNQMNKTQLDAVPDANHFTLGNDLDLAIIFNMSSGTTVPSSDGVAINFDANSLNQGAVLGTDYNWDFPAADKVRITSLAAQNLKVRVI
jgi:glutamine cyclotransferase